MLLWTSLPPSPFQTIFVHLTCISSSPPPIGIPSAVQQSGFLFGVVLLMIVAMITDYTVILLVKNGHMANKFSYQVKPFIRLLLDWKIHDFPKKYSINKFLLTQEMVTAAFGRPGYWYLTFVQFLFPFFGKWKFGEIKKHFLASDYIIHIIAMAGYIVIVGDTISPILHQICKSFCDSVATVLI